MQTPATADADERLAGRRRGQGHVVAEAQRPALEPQRAHRLAPDRRERLLARGLELVARAPGRRERRVGHLRAEEEEELRVLDRAGEVPVGRQVVRRLVVVGASQASCCSWPQPAGWPRTSVPASM